MVVDIISLRYNNGAKHKKELMKMKKIFALILTLSLAICSLGALTSCSGARFDENKNISVVTREDGSGTKSAFMDMLGLKGKQDVSGIIIGSSTAAVLNEVRSNPLAIGYDSLGYITDDVKMLKVDGVEATVENIRNGSYKISRPLNIVYQESNAVSDLNTAFLTFIQSSDAQSIISANGYVSTRDGDTAYTVVPGLAGEIAVSGSTSLQPLMEKLAARFEEMQNGVKVTVAGGGSGTGYNNAKNGVSDFGMISESFNQEKAEGCTYYEVAIDGIAVIVNKLNTFDNISISDLKNIYDADAGDSAIKTWSNITK